MTKSRTHWTKGKIWNWPLAANFEATNVTFLPKKLASNVQYTCIDNSKRPKSELWHYCIKATICSFFSCSLFSLLLSSQPFLAERQITLFSLCIACVFPNKPHNAFSSSWWEILITRRNIPHKQQATPKHWTSQLWSSDIITNDA